ncbi:MAG TPA: helix-hairpin-helix domain-containing protein [Blastocatellia bacterium]|nr:helix-hairpin-helix domain-containing protein [Blastocatellia bacterium]
MKPRIILIALMAITLSSCKAHRDGSNDSSSQKQVAQASVSQSQSHKQCVNLNAATARELKDLPGIGEVMAQRIIDYRDRHGSFRRTEDVIIIQGISEKKYRAIAGRICIE